MTDVERLKAALEPFVEAYGYYKRQTGPRFLKLRLRDLIFESDFQRAESALEEVEKL